MYSKSGLSYSAEVYMTSRYGESRSFLTPIRSSIKDLERYIRTAFFMESPDLAIDEIVVLKQRRCKMPKIHGYYDWVINGKTFEGRMKLDRSKPVLVHNALYGLE